MTRCNMRECAGYEFPCRKVALLICVAICESVPGTRRVSNPETIVIYVAICESVPGTSKLFKGIKKALEVAICESVPGTRSP